MKYENMITVFKLCFASVYSFVTAVAVVSVNDSYTNVFSDPFFWAAAFIGMGLMLLIENTDQKAPSVTPRRIAFSIFSCLAIIFIAGTIRAGMMDAKDFSRSYFFYSIVLFACSIAPEAVRIIVTKGGIVVGNSVVNKAGAVINGLGTTTPNVEPTNTENDVQ